MTSRGFCFGTWRIAELLDLGSETFCMDFSIADEYHMDLCQVHLVRMDCVGHSSETFASSMGCLETFFFYCWSMNWVILKCCKYRTAPSPDCSM